MSESSSWDWFHDLIRDTVAPTLTQFGFSVHLASGFPGDDNWEWQGGMSFRNPAGIQVEIDLLDRTYTGDDYYLVRCHMYGAKVIHLKYFLYPEIYEQTRDTELWQGWKCYTKDDVRAVLTEIATGLYTYFTQYPTGK